jgi:hypothetical protein
LKKASLLSKVRDTRVFIERKLTSIQFPALRAQAEEVLSKLAEANADMSFEELEARSRDGDQVVARLNEIEEYNGISEIATQRIKRIKDDLNSVVTDAPYLTEITDAITALESAQKTGSLPNLQNALTALNGTYDRNKKNLDRDRVNIP